MRARTLILFSCMAGLCSGVSDLERMQIEAFGESTLTGVKALSLAVVVLPFEDKDRPDDLVRCEAALRTKTELILRRNGIGILSDDERGADSSRLCVDVCLTKIPNLPAYATTVQVELMDLVTVPRGGDAGLVFTRSTTWPFGSWSYYGPSIVGESRLREYVIESVTTQLEMFCNDYLAANPRPPATGMFHELQRESRTVDSPATQKDTEIRFTPIDGRSPEESSPLPPGSALDGDPNEAERGFTAEELDAMERIEREQAAMGKLNRLGQLDLIMNIEQFRQRYPAYSDLNDVDLARRVHSRFYPDVSFDVFAERFGLHAVARAGINPAWTTTKGATEELARRWGLNYTQRELMGISGVRLDLSRIWIDKTNRMNLRKPDILTKAELILRRNGIPFADIDSLDADVLAEAIAKDYAFLNVNVGTAESKSGSLSGAYVEVTLTQVVEGGVSLNKQRIVGNGRVAALLWAGGGALAIGLTDTMPETILTALTRQLEAFCNDYLAANPRPSNGGMFDKPLRDFQANKPVTPGTSTKGKRLDGLLIESRAKQMQLQSESQRQSTPVDANTPQGPSPKQ